MVRCTNRYSVLEISTTSATVSRYWRPFRLLAGTSIVFLALAVGALQARAEQATVARTPNPWTMCAKATNKVEREHGIPRQLLRAISKAESGRFNKQRQVVMAWPWTVMAEGRGRYLESKAEAIAEVEGLRARGVRNIDVGCMQINLMHHPDAFASLDAAFDPITNVRYAASFLKSIAAEQGSWAKAAAYYHSQTPARYRVYRSKVRQIWAQEREKYLIALARFRAEQQAALSMAGLLRIDAPVPENQGVPAWTRQAEEDPNPQDAGLAATANSVDETRLTRPDGVDIAAPASAVGFRRAGPVRTTILAQSM